MARYYAELNGGKGISDLENKIVKVLKKENMKESKIDWDSMPTVVIGGDINNIKNNKQ